MLLVAWVGFFCVGVVHAGCAISPNADGHVDIPADWTTIDYHAFYECTSLKSITFPDSVTSIGENSFEKAGLTSITIPNTVTSIIMGAFSQCMALTSATIGDSVTSIGKGAFAGCSELTSVTIGDSVTSIESQAFMWTGLSCVPVCPTDVEMHETNPPACADQCAAAPIEEAADQPSTDTPTQTTATQASSCSSCASAVFQAFRQTEAQAKKDGACPPSAAPSPDGKKCRMEVDGRFWTFGLE